MSDTQTLALKAIKASQERNWQEGISLNESILETEPENISAMNRLAFCYLQTAQAPKAKKLYEQVIALEHHNGIAQKYLALIKQKLDIAPPSSVYHEDFIEEPGKTKSVTLVRLADPDALLRIGATTQCELVVKNHRVDVKTSDGHIYLGALPDDIAFRLQKLIHSGNTYSVFVQSTSKKSCVVFIKELTRGESVLATPSFPVSSSQSPVFQEDVLLEESPLDTRETGNDESESEPEEPEETTV